MRTTLLQWAAEANIAKKTAGNIVSKLMKEAGLEIRKRQEGPTDEEVAAAAEILAFAKERYDEEKLVKLLRLAAEQAGEIDEENEENEETDEAPVSKAA